MPLTHPPAVQLYTLRDRLAADRKATLQAVADFGYGAVEPFDVLTDPAQLRADLDSAGLRVSSVHARPFDEQAQAVFAGTRILGADTVIVPMADPALFDTAEGVLELAARLNSAAREAAEHGLRLGYHNHAFELASQIGGRTGLEALADALDPEVLLEVDTYWAAVGGQDVPELLRRLGERVRFLHVKDGPVNQEDPMTAVGGGRMPVAEILAANPHVEWHIVELDHCATDLLEAVGDSLAWLAAQGLATPVRTTGEA